MNKIAVVSSSRADYWLLKPLLSKLKKSKNLELFISGENVQLPSIEKIQQDGFKISEIVECLSVDDSYVEMAKAIARGVINFSDVLSSSKPDIIVLLGDRFEIFATAVAAYSLKIPIAHIHGGEVTHGALDDGFRHAISKMAGLHFTSHEDYKNRLLRMGEMPERVHVVGAIGLDTLDLSTNNDDESFFKKYSFLKNNPYILLTLHSSTLGEEDIEMQATSLIKALNNYKDFNILITQSNRDPGGVFLNHKWGEWASSNSNVHFVSTLGDDYLKAVSYAQIIIGNSSSGILEVPYLNKPVINIGNRQDGRIFPRGVYAVAFDEKKIRSAMDNILKTYEGSDRIYGKPGYVSEKIYDILMTTQIDDIVYKKFYDA
jgi:UDP-hydrolysing UDP-N-acetyl-D-glucosamine 2-epimerase